MHHSKQKRVSNKVPTPVAVGHTWSPAPGFDGLSDSLAAIHSTTWFGSEA